MAAGHSFLQCLTQVAYGSDPTCAAHWNANTMLWHFGNELDDGHHLADRDSYKRAVAQWEGETNPNSPWNATKDLDGITHPNMKFASGGVLGMGRILQEDASNHIPRVAELWVRHDVEEIDCGDQPGFQACSWYNGTGTPGGLQIDEWSVWQEELGHAQNVSHHDPPTGHDTHTHQHTMSGTVVPGEITKRDPLQHENEHACYGYQVSHGYQCF
ncbi:MAG: hypothetical protein WD830_08160 [Chloroflexota bacterium]